MCAIYRPAAADIPKRRTAVRWATLREHVTDRPPVPMGVGFPGLPGDIGAKQA